MVSCSPWERFWPSPSSLFAGTNMGEETAFVRNAKQHKGAIASGAGGLGLGGLLFLALPYFNEQGDSNARQWQEISALKNRVVILETKLDFYLAPKEKEPK